MGVNTVKLCQLGFFLSLWLRCGGNATSQEWDYLVYSQKWPITFCIYYTESVSSRTCILPEEKFRWTIHGLWPSKFHGEGPYFCNASAVFDKSKIVPIKNKMMKFWPNLEGGHTTESLWKHEWEKHGTCALDYEPLNDELKYFRKGLSLYSLYNMTSIMSSAGIFPDKNKVYDFHYISGEVTKYFGKIPYVECVEVKSIATPLLSEIRLCFNKDLEMMDCLPHHWHNDSSYFVTNCPLNKGILYPKDVTSKFI